MKPHKYVTVLALLNALTFCLSGTAAQAAQGTKESTQRGGKAESHMSEKGTANSNAQWSADPVRGWIRAGERHELHDGKQKGNKSKKYHHQGKGNNNKAKQ